MKMTEKMQRSRLHAQNALDAYRACGGQDDDDVTAIGDLIADLLHLAQDVLEGDGNSAAASRIETMTALVNRALDHYVYESDPAHAGEEV